MRKIELMNGAMNRVDFDCRDDVEARLLEAETHAPGAREKIDSDGSGHAILNTMFTIRLPRVWSIVDRIFRAGDDFFELLRQRLNLFCLALPYFVNRPTGAFQRISLFGISFLVASQFRQPVFRPTFRRTALRAFVRVPKTSVHKNCSFQARKNDIRRSGQVFAM